MQIIVMLELNPLASRRDFDTLRQMQSQPTPVNVYRSYEELLAAVAGQTFAGPLGCCPPAEPLADPSGGRAHADKLQRLRLDEIERQLGRVIDLLNKTNAAVDAHARHLGNLDAGFGTVRRDMAGIISFVEQAKKETARELADIRARFVTGAPEPKPVAPAPSVNGKPHNNGQSNGQCPGSGPLDIQKH